ncbi:myo-inositol transporter [Aureobasidium subglaciale]|nr:myo-inositol transporter [Aureobasidium subglaciale]
MAPRQSLDKAHLDMALPDKGHIEQIESVENLEDDSIETLDVSWFVWLVAITASIAGGLFGYDTGIISAILVSLGTSLDGRETTSNEKELITSLCSGGAFFGCIISGLTADKFGRKGAIYAACVLFFAGSILQASSYSIAQMAVGRLVVGFGVGSASAVVPMYLAEIAPTKVRGRLMGLNNMSITGGQVLSYGIGAAFNHVSHGWRYMAGLGALPPIILVCLLPYCPESPRQLIYHNKLEEAEVVIRNIYKGASELQIRNKVALIGQSCELSKEINEFETRWAKIKRLHQGSNFRALLVACGLAFIAQMSGFNTSYYSSTLFALVGFSNPVAVGLVVAGTNFVMTWVNMMIVDPFGRRRLLVYTAWGMSAGLVAVAIAFSFIPIDHKTLELENTTVTPPAIVVLVFIIWFVFFYGVSVGNTAWMSTDFFPMDVRAMGTICTTWGSNVVVSSTFLSMMKAFTPSGAFGFYAGICFFGWILIILCYPEVSGLTLEEVQDVFSHGFGVRYASKLRKERKLAAQQPGNEKI